MKIPFDQWKAEYEPRIYLEMECDDHAECECEFLYTYELGELSYYLEMAEDDKESGGEDARDNLALAISENRVWTWEVGRIINGVVSERSDLLITTKAWTENTEVI